MAKFIREFDDEHVSELTKNGLWKLLKKDVESGEVFPAIRINSMQFYHKGGRLFMFDKAFETNIKYASVLVKEDGCHIKGDISERELKTFTKINNFIDGYHRIKENCETYAREEAKGVSEIYHRYSHAKKGNEDIVVLDIEVTFTDEAKDKDRIDMLLYDTKTKTLRFYEVKHFSNKDIWASKEQPRVVKQIQNYNKQIERYSAEIIEEYSKYVRTFNELFKMELNEPEKVEQNVTLLVFGFDRTQLKAKIKKLLEDIHKKYGIDSYHIGTIKNVKINNLWEKSKRSGVRH